MSIVITVIDHNLRNLYMYGDKRRGVINSSGGLDRSDDATKIWKLKDDLFFGMTGIYETGFAQYQHLAKFTSLPVSSLLIMAGFAESSTKLVNGKSQTTNIVIAGKDEYGRFFIWTREGSSPPSTFYGENGKIQLSIAAVDELSHSIAKNEFTRCITDSQFQDYEQCIEAAILEVSKIDDSVCADFDYLKLTI